ncbi:MAG: response regulator [Proteobacteria bacterium]|nr:response regulator [Pseudomonadota bacterium]
MSLGTNAAHAMREAEGTLEIELKNIDLDETSARQYFGLKAGRYMALAVSDTGTGIDPEIRDRIFEPYFTTKDRGEGTGFGLAVVHRIVQDLGGTISVYSEPGQGTTFKLLIPCDATSNIEARESVMGLPPGGLERVLLVDDEKTLLETAGDMLERLGYQATTADGASRALELFQAEPERFDILITDLTMPRMNGFDLARQVLEVRPGMPVILCTGFSERVTREAALEAGIRQYLNKPLSLGELGRAVRQALT